MRCYMSHYLAAHAESVTTNTAAVTARTAEATTRMYPLTAHTSDVTAHIHPFESTVTVHEKAQPPF